LKRQHVRFFRLIEHLFSFLEQKGIQTFTQEQKEKYIKSNKSPKIVNKALAYVNLNRVPTNLIGLKFLISGRLRGKLRKKKKYIQTGTVPIQQFKNYIEFETTQVLTRYGVFGLKL